VVGCLTLGFGFSCSALGPWAPSTHPPGQLQPHSPGRARKKPWKCRTMESLWAGTWQRRDCQRVLRGTLPSAHPSPCWHRSFGGYSFQALGKDQDLNWVTKPDRACEEVRDTSLCCLLPV